MKTIWASKEIIEDRIYRQLNEELANIFRGLGVKTENELSKMIRQALDQDPGEEVQKIIHSFRLGGHPKGHWEMWIDNFTELFLEHYRPYNNQPEGLIFFIWVLIALEDGAFHAEEVAKGFFRACGGETVEDKKKTLSLTVVT